MEKYNLENDLKIFCVTAKSFPEGIMEAFTTLKNILPSAEGRTFFGISCGSKDGNIIYKAAVLETYEGEGEKYRCETFIVKKAVYLAETLINWRKNVKIIGDTFMKLLADPRLDTSFPCVEWYKSDDEVMCMIRIDHVKEQVQQ
jgi:hypothetical protein